MKTLGLASLLLATFSIHADQVPFTSVPLPKDDQLPKAIRKTLDKLPPLNVYRMMANVPTSFQPWIDFAKSLLNEGKFPRRLRGIAIMRQAHTMGCDYEWHEHSYIVKAHGVTDQELAIIQKENPVVSLSEEENFLCQVADEITLNARLKDATFKQIFTRYSIELGTELITVISYFNMLGRFINSTRVQIEPGNPLEGRSSAIQ